MGYVEDDPIIQLLDDIIGDDEPVQTASHQVLEESAFAAEVERALASELRTSRLLSQFIAWSPKGAS